MFTPADLDIMILSHDRPEYVGQAIQSILNQSVQGFSIQVLDNGSGPETDKVLASFGDKIAIHKSLENKGGEWNYQRAVNLAKNKLTMIFHDDDVLHPRYIEFALNAFTQYPDADLVSCGMQVFTNQIAFKEVSTPRVLRLTIEELAAKCYFGYNMPLSGVIYQTYALKSLPPMHSLFLQYGKISDRPWVFQAGEHNGCILIDESMVGYRIHSGQDSQSVSNGPFKNQTCALHKCYHKYLGGSLLKKGGRSWLLNNYRHMKMEYRNSISQTDNCSWKEYLQYCLTNGGASMASVFIGRIVWPAYSMVHMARIRRMHQ